MFIIEGIKSIAEFVHSPYELHSIYHLPQYRSSLPKLPANIKLFEVNNAELDKISTLQAPQGILALVYIPEPRLYLPEKTFSLMLDGIQDPGNLGTIIRTADWFGFRQVICSTDTVEVYNPKAVQATMGSLSRVAVFYEELSALIKTSGLPVYGAVLNGNSIYDMDWGQEGFVILGNEGQGIRPQLMDLITVPVTIPRIGGAESLNVAVSAAIFCSELSRKTQK